MAEIVGPNQVASMHNDNDMNRQYIEDNHIVDRYLLDKLTEQEASAFEAFYFEHPEMLEELKIAKSMQETLRQQAYKLQAVEKITSHSNWLKKLFQPELGFALSALLGLGVIGLVAENNRLKSVESIAYQAPLLTISQTRGSNLEIPKIGIAQSQSAVVLRLELGPIGYPEVRLQLHDGLGDLLWQQVAKIDDPLGVVNLVLLTREMKSGIYQLSVFPDVDGKEALSLHKFEVVML